MKPLEDKASIIIDFPIKEIDPEFRKTVAEMYPRENIPSAFLNYVCVAVIIGSGDHLIVPPDIGRLHFTNKQKSYTRPALTHTNHADFVKLINGEQHGSASKAHR